MSNEEKGSNRTKRKGSVWRILLIFLVAYGVSVAGLSSYWSWQPATFDVAASAQARYRSDEAAPVIGVATAAAIVQVATTLLDKPGGYLSNDRMLPGLMMDNMPNWEAGVLKELRDSVRALRNDLSRSGSQSVENADLREADAFINSDAYSWFLPSTESQYRQAIAALERYTTNLADPNNQSARFFARADNLSAYLTVVDKRLGSYAQRLSASVADSELTAALVPALDSARGGEVVTVAQVKTPRNQVDDVFYEVRGYSWALLHTFRALAEDFDDVLQSKRAVPSMRQVILDLEAATVRMWSPVVLNGSGFGVVNNHSLVLASYISRANAAVIDLRMLLQEG